MAIRIKTKSPSSEMRKGFLIEEEPMFNKLNRDMLWSILASRFHLVTTPGGAKKKNFVRKQAYKED